MPVRAIIKPAIYREKRFSCACRAIRISLETPWPDRIIFVVLVHFGEFFVKILYEQHSYTDSNVYKCNKNNGLKKKPGIS